ncbi:MAG: tetratricopeptide repeat protein [Bacteroidales bacterium]|nr:tetratricopeptide repeat protein [Bacteroidales bacterium]
MVDQKLKNILRLLCISLLTITFFTSCHQNSPQHYFSNGSAKFQLQDYKGAVNDFSKAIELKADYKEAYYSRAICYSNLEKYHKAMDDFNKAIDLDPEYANAYNNRAFYVKEKTGDYEGAIEDYNKFIELNKDNNNAFAYSNRGYAKLMLNHLDEAMEDIEKSINLDSTNSFVYKNRALIYINLDSIQLACLDLNRALELGYTNDYDIEVEKLMVEYCPEN